MRFMILVKATKDSEAGVMPTEELLTAMVGYHEELAKAGVLLDGNGLKPTSEGWRIRWAAGKKTIVDGPFTEAKELVAGFWIIQVKDRDEVVAWMRKAPFPPGSELEIRQLAEVTDFPADPVSDEYLRREQEWRDATQKPIGN